MEKQVAIIFGELTISYKKKEDMLKNLENKHALLLNNYRTLIRINNNLKYIFSMSQKNHVFSGFEKKYSVHDNNLLVNLAEMYVGIKKDITRIENEIGQIESAIKSIIGENNKLFNDLSSYPQFSSLIGDQKDMMVVTANIIRKYSHRELIDIITKKEKIVPESGLEVEPESRLEVEPESELKIELPQEPREERVRKIRAQRKKEEEQERERLEKEKQEREKQEREKLEKEKQEEERLKKESNEPSYEEQRWMVHVPKEKQKEKRLELSYEEQRWKTHSGEKEIVLPYLTNIKNETILYNYSNIKYDEIPDMYKKEGNQLKIGNFSFQIYGARFVVNQSEINKDFSSDIRNKANKNESWDQSYIPSIGVFTCKNIPKMLLITNFSIYNINIIEDFVVKNNTILVSEYINLKNEYTKNIDHEKGKIYLVAILCMIPQLNGWINVDSEEIYIKDPKIYINNIKKKFVSSFKHEDKIYNEGTMFTNLKNYKTENVHIILKNQDQKINDVLNIVNFHLGEGKLSTVYYDKMNLINYLEKEDNQHKDIYKEIFNSSNICLNPKLDLDCEKYKLISENYKKYISDKLVSSKFMVHELLLKLYKDVVIPNLQSGGFNDIYYHKYIKYKNKYTNAKITF
jgi:hypothetical protein